MMPETVLISTFYSFQPFVAAAHTFSPSKIILVVAEDSLKNNKVSEDIDKVKEVYGNVAKVEILKVKGADLLSIAKMTVTLLEKEEGRKIVNISGGWKLLAQGVLHG